MAGSAIASTPEGGGQGTATEPPTGLLDQLVGVAVPLLVVGAVIAILVGLGILVARLGSPQDGPAADPAHPAAATTAPPDDAASALESPQEARAAPTTGLLRGRRVLLVWAVPAAVLGVVIGRSIAFQQSVGGLGGALGAGIGFGLLLITVIGLVGVAGIATIARHGRSSRATETLFVIAGILALGAIGGQATAGGSGGTYVPPVLYGAPGSAHLELQASDLAFVARGGGQADCHSVPDGQAVGEIDAMDLGEYGPGTMRAMLSLADPTATTAQFWIDGGDLPEGAFQPFWEGAVQVVASGADGRSGRLTFVGLPLSGQPSVPKGSTDWPTTISGALDWTCLAW